MPTTQSDPLIPNMPQTIYFTFKMKGDRPQYDMLKVN